jgi:dihydrofolate reductase
MASLIYSAIMSLDGYTADAEGNFRWGAPDDEVLGFLNDLERRAGTQLLGRKMYGFMTYWETAQTRPGMTPAELEFAQIWRSADKIVYSTTLPEPSTARTEIRRSFDPEAVRELKATAGRDLTIGGPELAAQAIRAGLVDEYQLFLAPIVVGGGLRALPQDVRLDLDLVDERRFAGGVVYLCYRPR